MILQALSDYYERKPELPRFGYEQKEIPFLIEIEPDGRIAQIIDTREVQGKKKIARSFLVPQAVKKSINVVANLFWGNAEYLLGIPDVKKLEERRVKSKEADYLERLREMRAASLDAVQRLPESTRADLGVVAVLRFFSRPTDEHIAALRGAADEIAEANPNLTFRLRGDVDPVCLRPLVRAAVAGQNSTSQDSRCLVMGVMDEPERLHPSIAGVRNAQSSGASMISFNLDAFGSYGKKQGLNAPVGQRAVFAYSTALKYLLRRDSPQKLQVGDATTVFWADHDCTLEDDFAAFFDEPPKNDDPDRGTRAISALFESARQGVGPLLDNQTRFFVLGLAPNAARIAIRYWLTGTVAEMADRILCHFRDLEMARHPEAKPYLSIFRLLVAVASLGKAENIPPNLGGEIMRSILEGLPYPETLFQNAVRRIRMEREITYPRAAILKACLNRKNYPNEKEITVSLDKDNTNPGYRLGRLFAVLERVQEEASPGLNATIRDRYYGAFSATPASVFATLMRMKNHHLAKLDSAGRRVNLEKLIGEIVDGLPPAPPSHLSLPDQGRFAIGYYHQRMDSGTYRNTNNSKENDNG